MRESSFRAWANTEGQGRAGRGGRSCRFPANDQTTPSPRTHAHVHVHVHDRAGGRVGRGGRVGVEGRERARGADNPSPSGGSGGRRDGKQRRCAVRRGLQGGCTFLRDEEGKRASERGGGK